MSILTFSIILALQWIHRVFGLCQLLSLAAIFICAAVFHSSVGPHEGSLRFLHTVPVTSREMAAPLPQPHHTALADAISSPFVIFSILSLSVRVSQDSALFFISHRLHTFGKSN